MKIILKIFILILVLILNITTIFADNQENWKHIYQDYISKTKEPYLLYDIDKNGVPELFYKDTDEFNIYTIENSKITKIFTDSNIDNSYNSLYLNQEGLILYTPLDNSETGIFYTSTKSYYDTLKSYKYMVEEIYKLDINNMGIYTVEKLGETKTTFVKPSKEPYISKICYINDIEVSQSKFSKAIGLGTKLDFYQQKKLVVMGMVQNWEICHSTK